MNQINYLFQIKFVTPFWPARAMVFNGRISSVCQLVGNSLTSINNVTFIYYYNLQLKLHMLILINRYSSVTFDTFSLVINWKGNIRFQCIFLRVSQLVQKYEAWTTCFMYLMYTGADVWCLRLSRKWVKILQILNKTLCMWTEIVQRLKKFIHYGNKEYTIGVFHKYTKFRFYQVKTKKNPATKCYPSGHWASVILDLSYWGICYLQYLKLSSVPALLIPWIKSRKYVWF